MMRGAWLVAIALPSMALGQQDAVKQGEQIFSKTCSIGYCHGSRGGVGGAPRLVSRGFTREFINTTVSQGVAGTAMPAFGGKLSRQELTSVEAYVASLNGLASSSAARMAQRPLSPEAERGRALFFDAVRNFGRCATCHEMNGTGIPVAAPISKVPADVKALRAMETPRVVTAEIDGESMPALVVSAGKARTVLFDLTSAPPVQRIAATEGVKVNQGSGWKHSAVMGSYSDAELGAILSYLKAAVQ